MSNDSPNTTMPSSAPNRIQVPQAQALTDLPLIAQQTYAIFRDSYRELSARKLFWLSLIISGLVVLAFAAIGINETGMTVLGFDLGLNMINSKAFPPALFYKTVFLQFGFGIWLTWAATILALVSTAGLIPEFVSSGAIETTLSKPISRLRLFLTKYVSSLLFVGLQVAVFTLLSFLVIGIRGGSWEPGIFTAIPLVLLFFSFLYCVCALLGLITRSAIAALLLTVLFWFGVFLFHSGEQVLLSFRLTYAVAVEQHDERIAKDKALIAELKSDPAKLEKTKREGLKSERGSRDATPNNAPVEADFGGADDPSSGPATPPAPKPAEKTRGPAKSGSLGVLGEMAKAFFAGKPEPVAIPDPIVTLEKSIAEWQTARDEAASTRDGIIKWHRGLFAIMTLLPKTSETMGLLERQLFSSNELADAREANREANGRGPGGQRVGKVRPSFFRIQRAQEEELRSRSVAWVVGSSLAFEAVVLGLACLIFARRDF